MVLAKQEQEVGQLRVRERMALGRQDVAQLAAGGQQMTQAAHVVVPVAEGPATRSARRRHPTSQELPTTLAQLAQHMG